MNKNTFDWKEIQEAAIKGAKEHPFGTLLVIVAVNGLSKALTNGISKLGPTIEKCWKYTVDKTVERLPKPAAQAVLIDDSIIEESTDCQQTEAVAA